MLHLKCITADKYINVRERVELAERNNMVVSVCERKPIYRKTSYFSTKIS